MSKTGLFLIVVALAIVLLITVLACSTDPISTSVLSAQAGIAAPAATMQADSIGAWLLKAAGIGVILLALVAAVCTGVGLLRKKGGQWMPGPNAGWEKRNKGAQVQQTAEKQPDITQLMMFFLLQQMRGNGTPLPMNDMMPRDDGEESIDF